MNYLFAVGNRYGRYHYEGPTVKSKPTTLCGFTPKERLAVLPQCPAGYSLCKLCERAL